MNNLKFCCEIFETYYYSNNLTRPNIRIVKYKSDFLFRNIIEEKFKLPYRFYITYGYEIFKIDMLAIHMLYCPFCGCDLYKFYNNDTYANEIEGKTFFIE